MTEERPAWGSAKGESSISFDFLPKEKKKAEIVKNQHVPGTIQKGGGEEGQSEERDYTFLLCMRFYSCLLQCCRKSGSDKGDRLHSKGNRLSVWFLLHAIGLPLIGSTSWDLNANPDQTIVPTECAPGNHQVGGGWVWSESTGTAKKPIWAARIQFSDLAPHAVWEY